MVSRIASLLRIKVPDVESGGLLIASGKSLPSDGQRGYQPGCIFQVTTAGAGTYLYCNTGTINSCSFKAVTVAS